jgi:predicted nucleotide-binding protein (sugar kinase/HSP70/actin superfamily)
MKAIEIKFDIPEVTDENSVAEIHQQVQNIFNESIQNGAGKKLKEDITQALDELDAARKLASSGDVKVIG